MNIEEMAIDAEKDYNSLSEKRNCIEEDKERIEAVIKDLDYLKNQALLKTLVEVNDYFGQIFHTLLPSAFSKLEMIDPHDISKGV